ncbi:hypothetical protein Vretimale_13080 [Volvox reticuliferus]|uniref:Uncharacterized protein n=1 Tax=Volvox reticuliferus TaxID=1737510 RepID=A0A8J4FX28_9CHLO|nr:hypothetical protein Vretifemale_15796 [Volvox reticuliferus]GIM09183.1 hypothetical protein Vretimale_13080 [Volvox reticuliferus]
MQLNIVSVAALLTALVCIANVGRSLSYKSGVVKTLRGGISLTSSEAQQLETSSSSSSSSTSLSFGSTTPPSYLLPLQLRPEIAYFDAETGIVKYNDHPYGRDIVVAWVDAQAANSPTGVLWLQGDCVLHHPGNGAPTSVHFDGISCYASQDLGLPPSWDDSPYSSFTLLWIGRPEEAGPGSMSAGHSRTPFTFENSLFSDSAAADAAAIDTGSHIPPPPINQWTMEVVSRSRQGNAAAPGGAGRLIASYYRYGGQSDELAAWRFPTVPSVVFYGKMVLGVNFEIQQNLFSGQLAVVLLYNRALQEAEVRKLAAFYSTRFGWRKPG